MRIVSWVEWPSSRKKNNTKYFPQIFSLSQVWNSEKNRGGVAFSLKRVWFGDSPRRGWSVIDNMVMKISWWYMRINAIIEMKSPVKWNPHPDRNPLKLPIKIFENPHNPSTSILHEWSIYKRLVSVPWPTSTFLSTKQSRKSDFYIVSYSQSQTHFWDRLRNLRSPIQSRKTGTIYNHLYVPK